MSNAIRIIAAKRFTSILPQKTCRWLFTAMMFLNVMCNVAHASSAPLPRVSVGVYGVLGFETFQAVPDPYPYGFGAYIEFLGGLPSKSDLYFGVIPPGFQKVFTWVGGGGTPPSISEELAPIARGIDMLAPSTISIGSILGQDILYTFTGAEPPGTYWIFALLVSADADPADEQHWIALDIRPLVFRP